jgi:ribosomal protein S27AE
MKSCPKCGYADGIASDHDDVLYCMNCDWKGTKDELEEIEILKV